MPGWCKRIYMTILYTLFGIILLVIAINAVWRLVSDRRSLPCPAWLGWMVELDNPIFRNDSAKVIVSHLALQPGQRVLDYGCGPGRIWEAAQEWAQVTGWKME